MPVIQSYPLSRKMKSQFNEIISHTLKGYEPSRNKAKITVKTVITIRNRMDALLKEIEHEQAVQFELANPQRLDALKVTEFFKNSDDLNEILSQAGSITDQRAGHLTTQLAPLGDSMNMEDLLINDPSTYFSLNSSL
jgi:hypothetical protein